MRRLVLVVATGLAACSGGEVPAHRIAGGDPERGREAVVRYGCGGCHTIPGVAGAKGAVGPPLHGIADRTFLAGSLPNEPAMLVRWIRTPRALVPGTAMPDLGVTEDHARDIAAYLYTLRSQPGGPPRLFRSSAVGH